MDWKARKAELDRLHRRVRVARTPSLLASWAAGWLRPPRAAHGEPMPPIGGGQVGITFGGHATALVRYHAGTIACDPMLGRWVGGVHRAVEPGLAPGELADVDVAVVSHAHADHLHVPTLAMLPRRATLVLPPGAAARVSGLGFARVIELATGAAVDLDGLRVTAAPVDHGDDELARGNAYVLAGDGPSVYFCGDAAYGPGFATAGGEHAPDLALLPIGGFLPWSFRARHMSPLDALYAFEDLRARLMVPIHHGAFALSYERLDAPARWLRELVAERELEAHVRVLEPGESEVFSAPRSAAARAGGGPGPGARRGAGGGGGAGAGGDDGDGPRGRRGGDDAGHGGSRRRRGEDGDGGDDGGDGEVTAEVTEVTALRSVPWPVQISFDDSQPWNPPPAS
ncbi:MAG: MBL fold metallo-hydrolase [Myxococcales bacterium]|nr:MBL fold metallo-hydrolase [Myxococcales bacterium]